MKKHIVFAFVLAAFCMAGTFAETKINVTQSIRYGNGNFVPLNTPQISRKSARKEGGKVYLKYDFEVTAASFWDPDYIFICIRVPHEYISFEWESWMKVTALSGATDVRLEVLKAWNGTENYPGLRDSIGRLPKVNSWSIQERYTENGSYKYEDGKDFFRGIPLLIQKKKGNKASIEFYIDFEYIESWYEDFLKFSSWDDEYVKWMTKILFNEIAIDITFHSPSLSGVASYSIPVKEYIDKFGYDKFWINVDSLNFETWQNAFSSSNKAYTLVVKE